MKTERHYAELDGKRVLLTFPYRPFLVQRARSFKGSYFDKAKKQWSVPLSEWLVTQLLALDFELSPAIQQWAQIRPQKVVAATTGLTPRKAIGVDLGELTDRLRPFQVEGV